MRLNFTLAVLVFSSLVLSCSKSSQEDVVLNTSTSQAAKVIEASISQSGLYELALDAPEGSAGIHKQASHFSVSSIAKDSRTNLMVYKYIPAKGFAGLDEVTLSTTKKYTSYSPGGGGCNDDSYMEPPSASMTTFVKIRFTVK